MAREDLIVWLLVAVVLLGVALILVLTRKAREELRYARSIQATVADVMSQPVVTVRENNTLEDAARVMVERGIGSVVVVGDEGHVVGILTDSDFMVSRGRALRGPRLLGEQLPEEGAERIYDHARGRKVRDEMTKVVTTIEEGEPVTHLIRLMVDRDIRHVPVVRGGVPVGIATRRDMLRLMLPHEPRG